jgi:hypothetical protein
VTTSGASEDERNQISMQVGIKALMSHKIINSTSDQPLYQFQIIFWTNSRKAQVPGHNVKRSLSEFLKLQQDLNLDHIQASGDHIDKMRQSLWRFINHLAENKYIWCRHILEFFEIPTKYHSEFLSFKEAGSS